MGDLNGCRYMLHDRDTKFCAEFRETLAAAGVKCLRLPPRSPNLNALWFSENPQAWRINHFHANS
jgi:hypothetical protein